MNRHDDAEQRVSAWLHDEARGELPDWVLEQTFERTRDQAQQRGLRGRLASITHGTGSRTRGRSSMFTLAGLGAVVATAALATTVLLNVSVDQDQPAIVPGAEWEPGAVVEISGQTHFGQCSGARAVETQPNGVRRDVGDGASCRNPSVNFEDSRLQGEFRVWQNNDVYEDLGLTLWTTGFSMHDDDGSWVQRPTLAITHPDGNAATKVIVMDGGGAYEGLTLVAEVALDNRLWDWRGYIIDGDLPPAPAIAVPE